MPGWYIPVTDGAGRQLVDGGLVANVPSAAARSLGADLVIAVDVNSEGAAFLGPPQSAIGVLLQSILLVQRTAVVHQWQQADLIVKPPVGHIRWDEISRADELIAAGEEAARSSLGAIKRLLESFAEQPTGELSFRRSPPCADERRTDEPYSTSLR